MEENEDQRTSVRIGLNKLLRQTLKEIKEKPASAEELINSGYLDRRGAFQILAESNSYHLQLVNSVPPLREAKMILHKEIFNGVG